MFHRKPVYLVPVMRVSMQNKILAESIAHRLIPWRGKETQFWRLRSLFLWVARMYGSAKIWFSKFCSHACPTGRHDLEKIRFPCPRLAFKTGLEKKTTKTIHLLRKNCGQFKRELFFFDSAGPFGHQMCMRVSLSFHDACWNLIPANLLLISKGAV